MLLVEGTAAGTTLTGSLYEPDEDPPSFRGVPDDGAPYVWICDEFYEVETGGCRQALEDRDVQVAFEAPLPRGFERRKAALAGAEEHLRTQFSRIGVDPESVAVGVYELPGSSTN